MSVNLYNPISGELTPIAGSGGGGGGHTILNSSGIAVTQRSDLQFNGCSVTDDSTNNKTIITPSVDISGKSDITSIGPDESGRTTASKAYAQGEHFYKDGKFCEAKTAITSGATLTLNTNYTESAISSVIDVLNSQLVNLNDVKNGSKERISVNLASFTRGYPSNTSSVNTTKRTFTKGTYVVGLAGSNYYSPSSISSYTMNSDGYYMKANGGYGIYYVLPDSCKPTYSPVVMRCKINYTALGGQVRPQIITYLSDGTYNKQFSMTYVPSEAGSHVFEYKLQPSNTSIEYILFGISVDMNNQLTISEIEFFNDYSVSFDMT